MFFLNGEIALTTHEINWNFGGKISTPDSYYSEGILKISFSLNNFGLSQDKIAALKMFEDDLVANNIEWIETRRDEWVIDADDLKRFILKLAREKGATRLPSLDGLKGFIPVRPEFEWEMGDYGIDGEKAYRVTVGLHIFKDTLRTAMYIPRGFWDFVHPEVARISKSRFESGHYADSVEAAMKEVNVIVKKKVRDAIHQELDGAPLMERAFSINNPVIKLEDDLTTDTGKNIQLGYMRLFAGAMIGVRNPKAHENVVIDANRAMHFLFLASLLLYKIDEAR
jgi:uncharacterized protein (TIGR02391 family)